MKKNSLKEYLLEVLSNDVVEKVNRSFEVVGDIAIIEVSDDLEKYSDQIAEALLKTNSSIKTVLKKSGVHHGEFRVQDLVYVAGEDKCDTEYLENGVRLKINPGTVYFSARLSTERHDLMKALEPNKRILVMFSGAGPYTLTALKMQPNLNYITSIEINPEGHKYALESLKLNKNLLKKTDDFVDFFKFVKSNHLPLYEKDAIVKFNSNKIQFINGDVKKEVVKFEIKKNTEKADFYDNNIFDYEIGNVYHILDQLKSKRINIDFDNLHKVDEFTNFFILFSEKFEFLVKIKGDDYLFESAVDKMVLLDFLKTKRDVSDLGLYDEIYMPLPKDAELFLRSAFKTAAKGAVVHMYDFVHEDEFPMKSEDAVKAASEKFEREVEIISTRKVGQYSPRKYRVCCDFKVL